MSDATPTADPDDRTTEDRDAEDIANEELLDPSGPTELGDAVEG